METRRSVIRSVAAAGIALGLAVTFGPWIASLFVDAPAIEVDGPVNAVMIILGTIFALPALVTLMARRRFAATTLRTVVAVVVNVGVTLFELLMVAVMLTDDSGDGQVGLILIIPIPIALIAAIVLGIVALVGRRAGAPEQLPA